MASRKSSPKPAAKPRSAARKSPRQPASKARRAKPVRKAAKKAVKKAAKTPARRVARRREPIVRAKPETLRLRSITPSLTVGDLDRSISFYTRGLGFVIQEEWVHDGRRTGVMLRAGACELGLGQDDWAKGRDRQKGVGARLYFETVQDIDALAERAPAAGGQLTAEPKLSSWGAYAFSIDDPDGFHLTVYKASPKRGG
jgi:lactoylglutathione lyase